MRQPKKILEPHLETDIESFPFKLITAQNLLWAVNPTNSDSLLLPELRNAMHKMVVEGAKHIFAEQPCPWMPEVSDESLSDYFLIGFRESKTGLKSEFFYFTEGVLTKMVPKGFLEDTLECNLERWTHSFKIKDTFTQRALNFPYFVNTAANFNTEKCGFK